MKNSQHPVSTECPPAGSTSSSSQTRIAVLGKRKTLLYWLDDVDQALSESGVDVLQLYVKGHFISRFWQRLTGRSRAIEGRVNVERIGRQLARFEPDLLLCLNKAGLTKSEQEVWRNSMRSGTPIIGWTCDHFTRLPENQEALMEGVYYFDTASKAALQQVYANTTGRIQYLPLAVNPARYRYRPAPFSKRLPKACFAGLCSLERRRFLEAYRAAGGEVAVFGPHSSDRRLPWRSRRLSPNALADIYRKHFICINIMQPAYTVNGLNLRAFEIAACGGLGTYPDVPDLSICFVPGSEILVYQSPEDLKNIVDAMIAEPEKAEAIAEAGHHRVLREHTWRHRTAKILQDWLPETPSPMGRSVTTSR